MTLESFVTQLREEFHIGLQSKTGWGRNEVMQLLDASLIKVMSKKADLFEEEKKAKA